MPIDFTEENKVRICNALEAYMRDNLDCDIGLLQSEQLFEFMMKLIGPSAYNQAVSDAQAWLQRKLLDLEGDLHEQVEYE